MRIIKSPFTFEEKAFHAKKYFDDMQKIYDECIKGCESNDPEMSYEDRIASHYCNWSLIAVKV
jgi:hypothetical protein